MFLDDIVGPKPIKESKKIKGADGKACWPGYRYNGTEDGKDSCVKVKKVKESAEQLNVGDPVVITGNVQFNGSTGDIAGFGQDKRFVIVDLYNHGQHSFHSSDVSYNDYDEDSEEHADGFYVIVASEDEGVFIGALTQDGNRWRETTISGTPPYNWGGNFMSYLTPNDIMKHIQQDYRRGYQVAGPFYDDNEVRAYAQNYFDADMNEDDWHGTGNEPADAWHLPAGATLGAGGAAPIAEYAAGDDNGDGPEDALFRLAQMWYSAPDVATQTQVEQALAKVGWEIGELESEEGGAFVMRIGDESGDSYIGWSEEQLAGGLDEGAPELLKAEMPLVRHIEQELTKIGYKKGTPEFNAYFNDAIKFYRQFGNFGFNKDQGVAEGSEEDSYSNKFVQSQIDYYTKHGLSGTTADRERINGSLNYYQHIKNKRIKDGTWQEQGVAEGEPSPMAKYSMKVDRIRSLKNLIAIAKEQGRQLRVQELEHELKKLEGNIGFNYNPNDNWSQDFERRMSEATGKPLIRKVTKTFPDGRTYEVYELLSANGVTIKTGMSKETAMSALKHYRQQYGESAAWQKKSGKNKNGGLNQKGVDSYRREHPGSKLQTAVTTKPSKLKPGSKDAKRRKSFCARMSGVDGPMKKPNGEPTRKALALRKWNCESVEDFNELMMIAESIREGEK
jgi:hypothetical protein